MANNTYFNHDTSRITNSGITLLLGGTGDVTIRNRQIFFTDPELINIIVNTAIPRAKERYSTNLTFVRQMELLSSELEYHDSINYAQVSIERLCLGSDIAKELGKDGIPVLPQDKYSLETIYAALITSWPAFALSRIEITSLNESTRTLLGIEIDKRVIQDSESFIAGATFTNNPASKIPDKIKAQGVASYTGVDITVIATMGPFISAIDDIKTITYSTHRDMANVFAMGSVNRKGIVRGKRTIAGTMICTIRLDDPMLKMHPEWMTGEGKQSFEDPLDYFKQTILTDQLPMFDILITFQNELGYSSVLTIFGINITDIGQVMSISDSELEMTFQYGAIDVDIMRYTGYAKAAPDGSPFPSVNQINVDTESYKMRRRKIILGETTANNPFINPPIPEPATFGGYDALL